MTSAAIEAAPISEMRFSKSTEQLKENLEERGLDIDEHDIECECGESNSLEDIVAVSKDEEGIKFFCKSCY